MFQRDLYHDFGGIFAHGHFKEVLQMMCQPHPELDAELVRKAMDGGGTGEELLSEVICTRTPAELKAAMEAYERKYQRNMEQDLKKETSKELCKVYCACLSPSRGARQGDVAADVESLHKAGPGKLFGTDESKFIDIIASSSRDHVEAVYWAYAQKYGKALDAMIRSEMSGDTGKSFAALAMPHHVLFAERILKSMKGMSTNDTDLIRLVVSQRGRHLKSAGKYFLEVNRKSISAFVQSDTSGDYKALMVKICQAEGV